MCTQSSLDIRAQAFATENAYANAMDAVEDAGCDSACSKKVEYGSVTFTLNAVGCTGQIIGSPTVYMNGPGSGSCTLAVSGCSASGSCSFQAGSYEIEWPVVTDTKGQTFYTASPSSSITVPAGGSTSVSQKLMA